MKYFKIFHLFNLSYNGIALCKIALETDVNKNFLFFRRGGERKLKEGILGYYHKKGVKVLILSLSRGFFIHLKVLYLVL